MIEEEYGEKTMQDYLAMLKRNKKIMLIVGLSVFLLAVIIAIKWPATYKATATILIEQQEIPQDLVRSTVTSYADQRIQVISQRVMSTANLKKIIDKYGLYQEELKTEPLSTVIDEMREDIHLEMVSADVVDPVSGRPTQATIAFTLSFEHESPQKAQKVANELVNLYLNENLRRRTEIATEATSFLAIEGKKLSEMISDLEQKIAKFKEENETSLPELQQLNMNLMDRTEQQLLETNRQLAAAEDRIVYLQAELAQIDPNMSIYSETGQRIYGSRDRLKSLQAELVGLKARYAANHPDVLKMEKEIKALEQEVGGVDKLEIANQLKSKKAELASLKERYSDNHPDVKKLKKQVANLQKELSKPSRKKIKTGAKPDNPAYIQLQAQLQAAQAERQAMLEVKQKLQKRLEKYEKGLLKTPQVEREYLKLTREHENAVMKFREVKAKQMEADMAQAMEKERKAERFSLIEPPLLPEEPYKPNRPAIIFLGFILAIGLAVAVALLKESLNPSVYGVRGLMTVTGEQPLVVVPYIETAEDVDNSKKFKLRLIAIIVGVIVLLTVIFHIFVMPLDVLWYVVFRKLGIS